MPDIEVPDADELGGNVTKPFKFVTGNAPTALTESAAASDISAAGYDARFPNQNQYVFAHHSQRRSSINRIQAPNLKRVTLYQDANRWMNRTKHCWQNYVDYHKCILAKGEEFKPCRQVASSERASQFDSKMHAEQQADAEPIVLPSLPITLSECLGAAME